jgi:hypothetical protein
MSLRGQRLREDFVSRSGARYRLEARPSGALFDWLLSSNMLLGAVLWVALGPISWLLNHLIFQSSWTIFVYRRPGKRGWRKRIATERVGNRSSVASRLKELEAKYEQE